MPYSLTNILRHPYSSALRKLLLPQDVSLKSLTTTHDDALAVLYMYALAVPGEHT